MADTEVDDRQRWQCEPCEMGFDYFKEYLAHKAEYRNMGYEHYHCPQCGKDCASDKEVEDHLEMENDHMTILHCPGCRRNGFKAPSELMDHIYSGRCQVITQQSFEAERAEQASRRRALGVNDNFNKFIGRAARVTHEEARQESQRKRRKVDLSGLSYPKLAPDDDAIAPKPNIPKPTVRPLIMDPDVPGFNAEIFMCQYTSRYTCPHVGCIKAFKSAREITRHLRSPLHTSKEQNTCPKCLKEFPTIQQILHHLEDANSRCGYMHSYKFGIFIGQLTAGMVDVICLANDTVQFRISEEADQKYAQQREVESDEVDSLFGDLNDDSIKKEEV